MISLLSLQFESLEHAATIAAAEVIGLTIGSATKDVQCSLCGPDLSCLVSMEHRTA